MKWLSAGAALLGALVLAACAHAQTYYGTALVAPPTVLNNCATWAASDLAVNALTDSGVGCSNHQLTVSDGSHGTVVISPTNLILPAAPAIIPATSQQPLLFAKGVATTGTDGPDFDFRRTANYSTGGTFGYVNTVGRFYDLVTADRPSFEWAFLSVLDNNQAGTQGSQNVAGYFQAHKRFVQAGTWALTAELQDHAANPTGPSVTFEYDLQSKGADPNGARVIQDLWAKSDDGNPTTVSYGQRFNTDANSTIGTGILLNGSYTNGINLAGGTYGIAPLIIGDGTKFCTSGFCVNYILHSAGVTYIGSSGGNLVSFSDAGAIFGTSTISTGASMLIPAGPGHNLCFDGSTCSVFFNNNGGVITSTSNLTTSGVVTAGGLTTTGLVSAANVTATGNITAGGSMQIPAGGGHNLCFDGSTCSVYFNNNSGVITSVSNLTTSGVVTAGGLTTTGLVSAANVTATTNITAGGSIQIPAGSGHNLCLDGATCSVFLNNNSGVITSTSNVTTSGVVTAGGLTTTGTVQGATVTSTGAVTAATTVTATGNVVTTGGNLVMPTNAKLCMDGASCTKTLTYDGTSLVVANSGSAQFAVNLSTGHVSAITAFDVGANGGVSCPSGITASTYRSVGGITTHC